MGGFGDNNERPIHQLFRCDDNSRKETVSFSAEHFAKPFEKSLLEFLRVFFREGYMI